MKRENNNSLANEATYQLQYYKNLYLTHQKIDRKNYYFFHNNYLYESNSRLLLYKKFNESDDRKYFCNIYLFPNLHFPLISFQKLCLTHHF